MSVFHGGGNLLRRGLTKLYSDTKRSYETATVASKPTANEDPDLKALHREFRLQKDRLLAWGLQWSDTNAAPSPDVEIDKKLDQAGLGHSVALVMSKIQELLVESERIQNPQLGYQDKKASPLHDLTPDEFCQSQAILSKLTACIDSLYTLSESRRIMSGPQGGNGSRSISDTELEPLAPQDAESLIEDVMLKDKKFIHSSWIKLAMDNNLGYGSPPPYDEVMPVDNTRLSGRLDAMRLNQEQKSDFQIEADYPKPIVVEYISSYESSSFADRSRYLSQYTAGLSKLPSSAQISHTGSLRLLGYTIDAAKLRHGLVYEVPCASRNHCFGMPLPTASNLRALIPSKHEDSDAPLPNLEDRFRLAFNILLSVLQLAVRRLRHHELNSSNIVLFLEKDGQGRPLSSDSRMGLRRPYLIPRPSSTKKMDEPGHAGIYRHAKDKFANDGSRPWAFDVYSLGLILLEIGLWTPVTRFWKQRYDKPTFTSRIKNRYVPKLASKCGTAFMKVVHTCMSAPDVLGADSSSQPLSGKYLLQISQQLARCCAIDIDGPLCERDLTYFRRLDINQGPAETNLSLKLEKSTSAPPNIETASTGAVAVDVPEEVASEGTIPAANQQTALKKWNNIDIPQECLDQWNTYLMPRVSKLLQKALNTSRESCSASLMMVGKSPETAKTTICIQCTSVDKVRESLKSNFRCQEGWGLVILKGNVRRSGKSRKKKSKQSARSRLQVAQLEKSAYQEKPRIGASVGAFRNYEHLPPVSFGGAILVDGEPFGMTVHHMLDAPSDDEDDLSDDEDEQRSSAQRCSAKSSDPLADMERDTLLPSCDDYLPAIGEELEISDDESESSTIRPDYIDIDTGNGGFWFADEIEDAPELFHDAGSDSGSDDSLDIDEHDDEDDRMSIGDIVGIDPADEEEIYVTQPALDDVDDDFFPCEEDRDEDHLSSHSLGYVHASSGIRRVMTGNIKHEVDWALIKIRDERLTCCNNIYQRSRRLKRGKGRQTKNKQTAASSSKSEPKQLTTIAPSSSLARLAVHSHGRTSGLQSGRISPALALVRLHGRDSFSSSWVVEGGGFGVPGDSGAWIYDADTGRLCGHVLAWGHQSKTAYMAPMEVLFEDIKRRLGADSVELPGGESSIVGDFSLRLRGSEMDQLEADERGTPALPYSEGLQRPDRDTGTQVDDGDSGKHYLPSTPSVTNRQEQQPAELTLSDLRIDVDKPQPSGSNISSNIPTGLPTPPSTAAGIPAGKDIPESFSLKGKGRQQDMQKAMKVG